MGAGQASKAVHVGGKGNSDSKHAAYLRKGKALGVNPEKKVGISNVVRDDSAALATDTAGV